MYIGLEELKPLLRVQLMIFHTQLRANQGAFDGGQWITQQKLQDGAD
jgi:hypothetical protein